MTMMLTEDEVRQLTRRRRSDAQAKALQYMGIDHRLRPDGSVAVLRSHAEKVLAGELSVHSRERRKTEPDFSLVR